MTLKEYGGGMSPDINPNPTKLKGNIQTLPHIQDPYPYTPPTWLTGTSDRHKPLDTTASDLLESIVKDLDLELLRSITKSHRGVEYKIKLGTTTHVKVEPFGEFFSETESKRQFNNLSRELLKELITQEFKI